MDDIDTRLEAERPEVADALRSMNWEERLEQARARRKAVLARNEASDKRPVVRIIDAGVMARRKAEADHPPPAEVIAFAPLEALPLGKEDVAASGAIPDGEAVPAADRTRRSLAARTAMGFGLGLGLGTSLLAGAWFLLSTPGEGLAPDRTATTARAAPAVAPPVASPTAEAPTSDAVAGVAVAPLVTAAAPAMPIATTAPEQTAAVLPAVLGGPSGRPPQPVLPEAPVAEAFRLPESAQGVAVAVLPAALLGAPTEALAALVPYQAPALAVVRTAPGQIDQRGPEGLPASGQAAPPIPVAVQAAAVLGEAGAAFAPPLVPGASAAVRPAAFPASPGTGPESDEPPTVSLAPPAPPAPPAAVAEPGIPGAASLFVRLAVPQTVPDAEAEEVVGLLREIGVGDSRVTRVGFKVNETHVRFYSPEDAAAAAALAEMIGTEARDHTSFRPRPPGGTLEIFLAGERTSPPPRAAASNRVRQQPPDELSRMRDRIVNRLRRGEHL